MLFLTLLYSKTIVFIQLQCCPHWIGLMDGSD
jgi:hypothetical protein